MLTRFSRDVEIQWNFFEANHGKGAVDGLGGSVKHAVWRRVKSHRVAITSPQQFAEYAYSVCPGIKVTYLLTAELDLQYHVQCRSLAKPIPDTLQVHHVRRIVCETQYTLECYATSTSPHLMSSTEYPRNIYYVQKSVTASGKVDKKQNMEIPKVLKWFT